MFNNRRLMQLLRQTGFLFPLVVILGILSGGMVVLQSLELSRVISAVFLDEKTLAQVRGILSLFLIIVFIRVLFTILNDTLSTWMAVKIKTMLRTLVMQKISRLGPAYIHTQQSGELVTAAMQGIEALDAYFSQYLPQVLLAVILPLIILAVVFPLDWVSGLIFLLTAPLIPFFMALVGKASENETKKQWKALSRLGADFLDTLQGLTTLKILGKSKAQIKRVEEVSDRYRIATMNVLRITFLSALVLEMLATISTAIIAVEIGLRLLYGQLQFQQAFFVLLLAPEFYQPMRSLGMRYHAGMSGVTASVRIFQLLDEPEPIHIEVSEPAPGKLDLTQPFVLSLKEVSFAYPQSLNDSLHAVNLSFQSGQAYTLVGHSGAGKSTLLKLVMRFIEPGKGTIELNAIDIRRFSIAVWRSQISWVLQKPTLFNTSLLENIRLDDTTIPEAAVWQALQEAQFADFAMSLPLKLATPLGEGGARLSGGQAQRVALARAFLKNAPLLLMDEPNAHLDLQLESALAKSIRVLIEHRTVITIAHHFSTLREADHLIVLDHGEVVEVGTHAELMKMEKRYHALYSAGEVNR
jgi:ATP-binding cassette subfamily C protein CydD